MKKFAFLSIIVLMFCSAAKMEAQFIPDKQAILDSLTRINPEIVKLFPRWRVCEPELQVKVYQAFVYKKYDKANLSQNDIIVLSAPPEGDDEPSERPFTILSIDCGNESMNRLQLEEIFGDDSELLDVLEAQRFYQEPRRNDLQSAPMFRDYCYEDIPFDYKVSENQASMIISFLEPQNAEHSFTLSVFEQSIKIGDSGFWLRNKYGVDEIGYHFWSAGQVETVLQRPLYKNKNNDKVAKAIPYLINAYIGGSYRVSSGINDESSVFSWVPDRSLNSVPDGKFVGGLDIHMPFLPEFGVGINMQLPFKDPTTEAIEVDDYAYLDADPLDVYFKDGDPRYIFDMDKTAAILKASGQFKLFYHWWLDKNRPENYFRIDFGISYSEVSEYGMYRDTVDQITYLSNENIEGLKTYKPNEFGDWVYAKLEYRNQDLFPFGASVQYSNQMLLGRVYIPLFGDWFYLEGKYSTPLRGIRPYEIEDFYMISPVIRLYIN